MRLPELTTSLETAGTDARFVVSCADPAARAELQHLGYAGVDESRFATPWFTQTAETEAMFRRFSAAIGPMVEQSAGRAHVPWERVLETFLDRAAGSGLDWWVYGSTALALRGLDVHPGDVDVNVDDAHLAGRLFDDLLVTPVLELEGWVASYAGRASTARSSSGSPIRIPSSTTPPVPTSRGRSSRTGSRRSCGEGGPSGCHRSRRSSTRASGGVAVIA